MYTRFNICTKVSEQLFCCVHILQKDDTVVNAVLSSFHASGFQLRPVVFQSAASYKGAVFVRFAGYQNDLTKSNTLLFWRFQCGGGHVVFSLFELPCPHRLPWQRTEAISQSYIHPLASFQRAITVYRFAVKSSLHQNIKQCSLFTVMFYPRNYFKPSYGALNDNNYYSAICNTV